MSAVSSLEALRARIRPALGDGSQVLVASHVLQMVLRMASSLIVTRLLVPEAYGVVAIVTSITYILTLISDMGLRAYIVRHENAGVEAIQTVWSVRLIRNTVLFAIMFFGAPIFAEAYKAPDITLAIRVCAFPFLIEGATSLANNLNERSRRVVKLTVFDFSKFLVMTLTTIIAAFFLRSYWAVVISTYAGALYLMVASYTIFKGPPIRFRLQAEHVRDLWKFWRIVVPASIITIIMTQSNTVVMARFFPREEVGKFMIASTLSGAVYVLTNEYVMRVFYPHFAELNRKSNEAARAFYYAGKRNIALFFAFGIGGLIGGGELLIRILYNQDYLGAGTYLSMLCLIPLAQLFGFPGEQAIIAKGFVRVSLIANILRLGWIIVAAPAAYLLSGPLALVLVMCLAQAAALPYIWWKLKGYGLLRGREEALILLVACVGAAVGYGCHAASEALIAAGVLPNF